MNGTMFREIGAAFRRIDTETDARAVILAANGKHFTAGLDLKESGSVLGEAGGDPARVREKLRRHILHLQNCFTALEECRAPVIAAIHGACLGGGIDLVSACDMRVCSADTWFSIQEINVAIVADVGTLQRAPHLLPNGILRELAYTGRRMYAEEAKEVGLVNAVYPDHAAMLDAVQGIAAEIASKSPLAVTGTKEMLNYTRDHTVADALNYIATWNAGMLMSDDIGEAIAAQQQKRDAGFADLLPPKRMVRRRA